MHLLLLGVCKVRVASRPPIRCPKVVTTGHIQPESGRYSRQVVVILRETSTLVGNLRRNKLLVVVSLGGQATVFIVKVKLIKIAAALDPDSAPEHHHHLRVAALSHHLRVAAFTASVALEGGLFLPLQLFWRHYLEHACSLLSCKRSLVLL